MQLWRLVKTRYSRAAFDGEGAHRYGGRWNSPGTRVAYASTSPALAVLEVLVHVTGGGSLPGYSMVTATLPDSLVEALDPDELPSNWNRWPAPPATQAIGDSWTRSKRSVALRVPSAIVEGEWNVLLNPAHTDFFRLVVAASAPFRFDQRLLR